MSEESLKHVLQPVLRVLKDLGGKFVFTDEEGNAFVLMSKKELVKNRSHHERQLSLPPAKTVAAAVRQHVPDLSEEIIDAINRDIALTQPAEGSEGNELVFPRPSVPKLRFEPLKGDLPPQLQD